MPASARSSWLRCSPRPLCSGVAMLASICLRVQETDIVARTRHFSTLHNPDVHPLTSGECRSRASSAKIWPIPGCERGWVDFSRRLRRPGPWPGRRRRVRSVLDRTAGRFGRLDWPSKIPMNSWLEVCPGCRCMPLANPTCRILRHAIPSRLVTHAGGADEAAHFATGETGWVPGSAGVPPALTIVGLRPTCGRDARAPRGVTAAQWRGARRGGSGRNRPSGDRSWLAT